MNKTREAKIMSAINKKTRNKLSDELLNNANIDTLKKLLSEYEEYTTATTTEAIKVAIFWCCCIRQCIVNNSTVRRLWSINSKLCIDYIINNTKAAEWLDSNLTDKMREVLLAE